MRIGEGRLFDGNTWIMMVENSLIDLDIDSLKNTLKPADKVELKRRTKGVIISLYKDGPTGRHF